MSLTWFYNTHKGVLNCSLRPSPSLYARELREVLSNVRKPTYTYINKRVDGYTMVLDYPTTEPHQYNAPWSPSKETEVLARSVQTELDPVTQQYAADNGISLRPSCNLVSFLGEHETTEVYTVRYSVRVPVYE